MQSSSVPHVPTRAPLESCNRGGWPHPLIPFVISACQRDLHPGCAETEPTEPPVAGWKQEPPGSYAHAPGPWSRCPLRLSTGRRGAPRHAPGARLRAEAAAPNCGKPLGRAPGRGPHTEPRARARADGGVSAPRGARTRTPSSLGLQWANGGRGCWLVGAVTHRPRVRG